MANMQDLRYLAQRTEPAVRIEEELHDRKVWIVCHACGQRLTEVPREVLASVPTHALHDYFGNMVKVAMERHACPIRIMELARQLPYTASQVAAGISIAVQSGQSAVRAFRSFEESIESLNAVVSVPVPCVRCGLTSAAGSPFCLECSKLEEKKGLQRLKEQTASERRKAERSKIRVIRFEED